MEPTITPLDATLGAIVTDVDLATLGDETWSVLEDAFHEHGVLIFPGQDLSGEEQVAFGARFGEIEQLAPGAKIVPISNQNQDGSVAQADEHRSRVLRGNEGWHTDSSYMPLAAKASVISAQTVPSAGGQTEWADMRAAYDELDEATKEQIADLAAYHSLYYSQAKIGHEVEPGAGYGFHNEEAPLRPLVKAHPATGRKALFIGRHAYGIPGLAQDESEKLLADLMSFACQAPRTYRHGWVPGDIVIWDNRCVLHRACPYDYSEPRVMRHTRIAGDPATEKALNTKLESNLEIVR
ncbi:MAG: TauD/TfdA family dioxygenase [Acidobacteriota bacterium]|nr:TauD/TfdA family dioxygenase [Acidobacteriota bacterium]